MARQRTRKSIALAALLLLLPHLTGCTTTKMVRVAPSAAKDSQLHQVHGVTTIDNEEVAFAEPGEVRDQTVYGKVVEVRPAGRKLITSHEIELAQVRRLWLEEKSFNPGGTVELVLVVVAAVVGIVSSAACASIPEGWFSIC